MVNIVWRSVQMVSTLLGGPFNRSQHYWEAKVLTRLIERKVQGRANEDHSSLTTA